MQVNSLGLVSMPGLLLGDNPLGYAQLAPVLLRCFAHWEHEAGVEGIGGIPIFQFFRLAFVSLDMSAAMLQAELCRSVAAQLEGALSIGVLLPASGAPGSTYMQFDSPPSTIAERDVQLVNYWHAGQVESRRHAGMPWSCTFDGTRIGSKSVLACAFMFPTNIAFWSPIQETGLAAETKQQRSSNEASAKQ